MINLILFKRQSEFFDYFKNQQINKDLIIVTPSPVYADLARRNNPLASTFTIQNFLQQQFDILFTGEELETLQELKLKKSKLLLYLGFLWTSAFPEKDIISFRKAYRFLTDLRSFTLSLDVFENALENEEESLKEAVIFFQNFMSERNIFDEHKGYFELSERLRFGKLAKEYPENRKIVFWGFDFFSPLQMDMLKSLGIRDEVYLGLYEEVFDTSYSVDWTGWLDDQKTNIIRLESPGLDLSQVKIVHFAKNGLARSIKSILKKHPHLKKNYYLATKDFSYQKIQEIPENKLLFKSEVNLLETSVKKLKELALLSLEENNDFEAFLADHKKEAIQKMNFIDIKTLSLLEDIYLEWTKLAGESLKLSRFSIELLFDIIELDAPRNNLAPQIKEELRGEILPIKMLTGLNGDDLSFICASKNYGSLLGKESFTDSLEKKLTAIGPVRRPGFIFNSLKAQIQEALSLSNAYLLLENGLEKEDLAWSEILKEIGKNIIENSNQSTNIKKALDFPMLLKPLKLNRISATKIQTFLDCPRKYYLQYISKDKPEYRLEDEVPYNVLGTIEHEVIQKYISTFNEYSYEGHIGLVSSVIKSELAKSNIVLEKNAYKMTAVEIRDYTQDAILALLKIKNTMSITLEIEKEVSSQEGDILRGGSIDLFAKGSGTVLLFDFKRSASSIPSLTEIRTLKKIQILFYRRALISLGLLNETDKVAWGYVNLSDIKESLIICNDEDLTRELTSLEIFKKIYSEEKAFNENIDIEYQELEAMTLVSMEEELNYLPNPAQASVCDYCEIRFVCPKKGIQ